MVVPPSNSTFEDIHWKRLPGPLHAEILDVESSGATPPLILLHGFTQNRRSWNPFLHALEVANWPTQAVIRVDLPGHGKSSSLVADLGTTADLLVDTCGDGIFCGYSMGGRVALHVALRHPDKTEALITIGATPGIEDESERHRRRTADNDLADTIERIGTEAFIEQWLAQPMFAGLPRSNDDLTERLANSPSGLAMSLRHAGTGVQEPLWQRLDELRMPVLLLAGARDSKFADIADRMAADIGDHATSMHIADTGHSAHLEQPEAVALAISNFLRSFS